MRLLAAVSLLVCALPCGTLADKPKVTRAMVKAMEGSIELQLLRIWSDYPVEIIGLTQGVYVDGYGAVFMSQVNLAPGTGISPFHPVITADEVKRLHERKTARLPQLRAAMRDILMNSAGSLDSIPDDQQIALGISFFYWRGESTEGLPAEIVMHGQKRALVDVKTGRADKATLASTVTVQEF
jgi:hypothetical protein